MRIMHLLKHCGWGNGHVHVAVDLACEQASRGHGVVFASGGGLYVDLLKEHGVRHALVPQTGRGMIQGLRSLVRTVIGHRPQVIHAHMMAAAALGYAATRLSGGALVTTVHNSFDGHSGLMRLGDRVVAVSEAERRLLLSRGYRADSLEMVHNGPIGSVRDGIQSTTVGALPKPYLMTLSGLHSRKRVYDAIDAFAVVADDAPDWHMLVVGEGPDEFVLKSLVERHGLGTRVIFTGGVLNPGAMLRDASIFISMSEFEPFGLVVAEARAAGCAVLVTRAGGMPELVHHGRAGILLPVGGVTEAANALRRLMTDPKELLHWRQMAALMPGQFSVQGMADDYEHVYQGAMKERSVDQRARSQLAAH